MSVKGVCTPYALVQKTIELIAKRKEILGSSCCYCQEERSRITIQTTCLVHIRFVSLNFISHVQTQNRPMRTQLITDHTDACHLCFVTVASSRVPYSLCPQSQHGSSCKLSTSLLIHIAAIPLVIYSTQLQ